MKVIKFGKISGKKTQLLMSKLKGTDYITGNVFCLKNVSLWKRYECKYFGYDVTKNNNKLSSKMPEEVGGCCQVASKIRSVRVEQSE